MVLIGCPECGNMYSNTAPACIHCGYTTYSYSKKNKNNVGNFDAFLLYLISFLIPLIGIIIGIVYLSKDGPDYRDVGQGCIILSLISIFFVFLMFA